MNDNTIEKKLTPFLNGQLTQWRGLPEINLEQIKNAFGAVHAGQVVDVGVYKANRYTFKSQKNTEFFVYERANTVFMIEVYCDRNTDILKDLPPPDRVLAEEIFNPDAYSHEYFYPEIGLLITVLQMVGKQEVTKIVRWRGIKRQKKGSLPGPELYNALENQEKWS